MKTNISRIVVAASFALVAASFFVACGSPTACDQALDKVQSCGLTDAHLSDAGNQCQAYAACSANCVIKAGCNDIKANIQGDTQNALGSCIVACGK